MPGHVASTPATAGPGAVVPLTAVRTLHRIAATLALLASVALVCLWATRRVRDQRIGIVVLALLALALGLSALGIITPGSRARVVLLGNLLGGFLMLALAWRLTRLLATPVATRHPQAVTRWALTGAALWLLQSALGVTSGAGAAFAPALAHFALSLVPGLCALGTGLLARRSAFTAEGTALAIVALLQLLLGGATALLGAPAPMVALHNVGAAIGLALLFGLVGRGSADR